MLYFLKVLEKFLNKYRISSARLQNWDYGSNAPYFITICTAHRDCFFGTIRDGEMHLSETGEIVVYEWLNTPVIRPDMNIALDEFVIMPNHFHGIIIIGNNGFNKQLMNVDNNNDTRRDAMHGVSPIETYVSGINTTASAIKTTPTGTRDARHCVSTNTNPKTNLKNQFGPQAKNLSSIIRGFKSAVTINARKINPYFAWQPRFHEHIIRDYGSYQKIQNYIIDNPKKWEMDDYWK